MCMCTFICIQDEFTDTVVKPNETGAKKKKRVLNVSCIVHMCMCTFICIQDEFTDTIVKPKRKGLRRRREF